MRRSVVALVLLAAHVAGAETMRRSIEPMRAADDTICDLLRAQIGDRCTRVLDDKRAAVYRSGTPRGITRVVVTVPTADGALIGPALDFQAVGAITPTIHDVTIDGRPGVAVEIAATFGSEAASWQTHAVVGCAPTGRSAWKCTTLDAGRCDIVVVGSSVTSATCGDARLSLR